MSVSSTPNRRADIMQISRDAMPDRAMNRVPEVTADFWLVKLMAVTTG